MVATALVERDVAAGRRLLRALDEAEISVVAAFWLFDPDSTDWVLTFAVPLVDTNGPFEVYLQVNEIASRLQPPLLLRADDIRLVETHDPLVLELQIHRGTDPAPFIGDREILRETLGDVYVAAAHVYRAERILGIDHDFTVQFAIRNPVSKRWATLPGRVVVKAGLVAELASPGHQIASRKGPHGVTADFRTIDSVQTMSDGPWAFLRKWVVRNGRVWHVEREPDVVPLEPPPPDLSP